MLRPWIWIQLKGANPEIRKGKHSRKFPVKWYFSSLNLKESVKRIAAKHNFKVYIK